MIEDDPFGKELIYDDSWTAIGKLPKDDKKRLTFYDKLFVEAYLQKIKLELIVLNSQFLIASKRQIVTYDQKLP